MKKTFFYIFRNNLTSQITTYFTRNQYFCTTVRVRTTQKYFNMPPKNDHWTKGERPPKGLSGRELGMYYRQKQLEKRRQQNFETRNDEEETHHQHKQRYNKGKMHVLKNF